MDRKAETLTAKYVEERLAKLPDAIRDDVRAMLAVPPAKRDTIQRYLADKFEKSLRIDRAALKVLDVGFKKDADAADARIRTIQSQRPAEPMIQALWDRGDPTPTYIYRRGDWLSPGKLVGPGVPSVLTDGKTPFDVVPPYPDSRSTGRRLAFARWVTQSDHPLTARVEVNRIWKHHFGTGIVASLGNFGRDRRRADTPGTAGLAGPRVRPPGLEPQGHAPSHAHERCLPPEFRHKSRCRENRSRQCALLAHAADASRCRSAVRFATRRRRPPG